MARSRASRTASALPAEDPRPRLRVALHFGVALLGLVACSSGEPGESVGTGGNAAGGAATGGSATGGQTSTGGSATGGAPAGGSVGTGGEPGDVDPCATSEWTCVPVEPGGPYGTKSFVVPARQNWVNTGLFLKTGETATIDETGTWSVTDAGETIDHGDCLVGDLVARIGLHYKDDALTCVEGTTTFTADKDGILFVGALAGNDLGETYETRADDDGEKTVTVTSTYATAPTIAAAAAADYPYDEVAGDVVEILGEHVLLTLPLATASTDRATLAAATARLDTIYEIEAELRGALPHGGQRIRFFPDGTNPGYMLAGNPVRMDLDLVEGGETTRISRAGEEGASVWGFAHELGHDFTFAPSGFWTYQENSLECWPNVFSVRVFEELGLDLHESAADCSASTTGSYAGGSWDAWEGLCFLRQFQFEYGWEFYDAFFDSILTTTSTGGNAWHFVHDRFEQIAGEDITPIFEEWDVPHP